MPVESQSSFNSCTLKEVFAKLRFSKATPIASPRMEQLDGLTDPKPVDLTESKKRKGGDVAAIFVHAGAGFHSVQNEQAHLSACNDAVKAGMAFLKNGGSAVDAVEAAVKVLENNEITNAGYGSNLAIDGRVECDATIVDHHGRSGAVGAMGQVLNPIHVARLVFEGSTRPLSLRRVPPNLLVGSGAVDYAFDNHVPVLPHDYIVSNSAKERWKRWTSDLTQAQERSDRESEQGAETASESKPSLKNRIWLGKQTGQPSQLSPEIRKFASLMNESQPYTPSLTPVMTPRKNSPNAISSPDNVGTPGTPHTPSKLRPGTHHLCSESTCNEDGSGSCPAQLSATLGVGNSLKPFVARDGSSGIEDDDSFIDPAPFNASTHAIYSSTPPLSNPKHSSATDGSNEYFADGEHIYSDEETISSPHAVGDPISEDRITDTVGAIAIDNFGNMAAASSSGGIGMKHCGRIGPAALVGIGTAVHPVHPGDKSKKCVAVVTSGTGEHMATSAAAGTCANRLYWGSRTSSRGEHVFTDDDDLALQSFVKDDFMGHPSVKHSNTAAAIGVMAVKRTVDGVWFHFAHNTDSFALCSMTSDDAEPLGVMSRVKGKARTLTTGGRSCGYRPSKGDLKEAKRRKKSAKAETKAEAKVAKKDERRKSYTDQSMESQPAPISVTPGAA